jgi:dihydroorotate dehydrogenase
MYNLVKPLLFRLEAERAHELVTHAFRATAGNRLFARILRRLYAFEDPVLTMRCAGLEFANPLGLAAGFDKRAELVEPMALLGFGHVEVGTVTPRAQPGNRRPRLFRLPADRALINRMGFNSPGAGGMAHNLARARHRTTIVGVNIGKNRDTALERATEDYAAAFDALAPLADYVAVNISSPNTPGLRRLHERGALTELLGALGKRNRVLAAPKPLFLKVSPDETGLEDVVAAGLAAGCAGFIATNTTLDRSGLYSHLARETGGLSGQPLAVRARATVAQLHRLCEGRVPIIGVGGVASGADAFELITAGASLVQLYTALVYGGPALPQRIKRDLASRLTQAGFRSVADAVGTATSV